MAATDHLGEGPDLCSTCVLRAAVALALVTSAGSLAVAYAVEFGLSTGAVLFNPAAGSLLPDVVGDDDVIDANSAMWTAAVTVQIALAPVAGFAIAAFGVEIASAMRCARRDQNRASSSVLGTPRCVRRERCP